MIMTDPHHITIICSPDQPKCRIDKFITEHITEGSYSRSRIKTLIQEGHLSCDGRTLDDPSVSVKPGCSYQLTIPAIIDDIPQAEDIKLDILYEDNDLIIINKPAGLVVHPAPGSRNGTLVNALLHHCGRSLTGIGGVARPGIVHRLDKYTSGVMVAAKSQEAHHGLSTLFAKHRIHRKYEALCWGVPSEMTGTIDAPLGRHSVDRKKQTIRENGRSAITHYRVIKLFPPFGCHIECSLETGRTHQIRVHLTSIGHSIIGDAVYGRPQRVAQMPDKISRQALATIRAFERQALHASELGFIHPVTKQELAFKAPFPEDLKNLHTILEQAVWERGHTNY
jgi:23S rRNA pseudouridine1911/1915/1917 synthase